MAKRIIKKEHYQKIMTEAEQVSQVLQMPGWEVIATDIRQQMTQIERLLAENRMRSYEETVTTKTGSRTTITTAETQIAENAGMYKMGRRVLDLVQRITTAPTELHKLRERGIVTIEGEEEKKSVESKGGETDGK